MPKRLGTGVIEPASVLEGFAGVPNPVNPAKSDLPCSLSGLDAAGVCVLFPKRGFCLLLSDPKFPKVDLGAASAPGVGPNGEGLVVLGVELKRLLLFELNMFPAGLGASAA